MAASTWKHESCSFHVAPVAVAAAPLRPQQSRVEPAPVPSLIADIKQEKVRYESEDKYYPQIKLQEITRQVDRMLPGEHKAEQKWVGFAYAKNGVERHKLFKDQKERDQYLADAKLAINLQVEEFKKFSRK